MRHHRSEQARRPRLTAPTRRSRLRAGGVSLAALLAAGCGAGPNAVTTSDYTPAEGLSVEVGEMRVLNALVLVGEDGQAVLSMAIHNGTGAEEELAEVRVGGEPLELPGDTVIQPDALRTYGGPSQDETLPIEDFQGLLGGTVPLVVRFATAGEATLQPPVFGPDRYFEDYLPPGFGEEELPDGEEGVVEPEDPTVAEVPQQEGEPEEGAGAVEGPDDTAVDPTVDPETDPEADPEDGP